jgi:putative redox protein
MPTLTVKHKGGMRSSISVRGHKVIADVPPEMGGEDRGPTPVDLLAGSLGTCIAFYIARWCKEAQIACDGFEVKVDYVHDRENHCIPVLGVEVSMPATFPAKRKPALLKVAQSCTVHNTLCRVPEIEVRIADLANA